ncbi:hypothetical protein [Algoriphagus halophytocola]|uniref:Uncharacterized protein n=1 Tax=Algoriphagus halophytocola TaxID=2991499 RepID=A0ABY6MKN9_9BACT|nr:hypothetical protein [Algoriphagus sp. TR-M5]UZD24321.1 hypothetical protein OM944_07415 [Algoriphagus sp. TR-M5]
MVYREVCTEVSQTAVSVLTNTPKHVSAKGTHAVPHTEAMRWDEVTHAAEVQNPEQSGIITKIVDVAAIGTRIFILPREVSRRLERPREVSRSHSSWRNEQGLLKPYP